ncbi:MAG: DUF3035 domain-containing protein [Magnetococcales bacterium]|nr:DUF3035 domain-containing protein [Magnetococcales bacterium]
MKRLVRWLLPVLAVLMLSGCMESFKIPFVSDFFGGPRKVITRKPLEVPPDLNTLPPLANEPAVRKAERKTDTGPEETATSILFGKQSDNRARTNQDHTPVGQLPEWMGSGDSRTP